MGATRDQLATLLEPHLDRSFRIDQIYRALYDRRLHDFAAMTDLPLRLRERLAEHFTLARPEVAERHAAADGTVKYLFRLDDGATIEAVDIPDSRRRTVCVSSQAGCALACRFCVTGFWGGGRDLTAGEILAQVHTVQDILVDEEPSRAENEGLNLVFMGMGEPLLNLDNLSRALEILFERLSWRRVTVSTAGIIPGIETMARWPRRPRLAISLHAPDDERRSALMPINQRYPLADLLSALGRFPLAAKEKITYEYILIRDFNDALDDADLLARRLDRERSKVNLIPLNPDPVLGNMAPPAARRVAAFQERLMSRGLLATVRRRRGDDVSAACGQLRAFGRDPRGFRRSQLSF